jgi:hypothetical protein
LVVAFFGPHAAGDHEPMANRHSFNNFLTVREDAARNGRWASDHKRLTRRGRLRLF